MLIAAAVLDAPDDPSGRGLLMVVTAVLVLALAAVHVRLLLRAVPHPHAEPAPAVAAEAGAPPVERPTTQVPLRELREPVDAARG